jgi:DNA-directed RNA polymerase subunit M/transcription elongation factor TFIIS
MEAGQGAVSGGGASSPTTSTRPGTGGSFKRKRSGVEFESSPGSVGEENNEENEGKRQPGVKRACNECRQQKVSHDQMRRRRKRRRRKRRINCDASQI